MKLTPHEASFRTMMFVAAKKEGIVKPKYPEITVKLVGEDGNIFNLMGLVQKALRKGGVSKEERSQFLEEVTQSNSYDQALQVIMQWVEVE